MDTASNPAPEELSTVEDGENADTFQKVKSKKTSKRKRDQGEVEMESGDAVAPKRPQFPPISGDRLKVSHNHSVLVKHTNTYVIKTTRYVACWINVKVVKAPRVLVRMRDSQPIN